VPEPVPNVFEELKDKEAPEEATSGVQLNPPRIDKMLKASSPEDPGRPGSEAEKGQDTRAPVGKDAGAAENTGTGAADGWQGGAEDEPGVQPTTEVDQNQIAPAEPTLMELDSEREDLVNRALAADGSESLEMWR
jgi:hypothetical protein